MKPQVSEEKVKPFRLVKYFTFTSLVVIFFGTIVLSLLNTRWARNLQLQKSEDYALLLVENLNHQVYLQFIIPVFLRYGKIQLRDKEQFEHMDKVVRNTLHSFQTEMVNIYDMNNIISYSFDQSLVGKKDVGGTAYQNAVSGQSTSKLIQRGSFWEMALGFPKESKLITFAPLRTEKRLSRISGPVMGVVEIVQDLSEDDKTIFSFQVYIIITCSVIMGVLFLVLLFIVKRGEGILEKRAMERLRLKEQLSRAEHLSTLGEMVAGISHEIRNPLGIIKNSAELLEKKMNKFDPSNPFPNIIVEEAGRLNNIITDFLNFARPKVPNLLPCRVEEILEKNITFLGSHMQEQSYMIEKAYAEDLPEITADAEMVYQAFLNILINAMQAMPGGGKILVNASSLENENQVGVCFEDEGEGIPGHIMDKIWDPFFTTKEKGTGLGLGIVKNIIESHGGSIQIENKSDQGTRVTIKLPVNQGD
ncbi:MAG: two-component sensor histidine kinase [Deltaproteobacteria bacterium]|nr:two-component sensor histidine kinase [Deltaproteobacteria bacterium]